MQCLQNSGGFVSYKIEERQDLKILQDGQTFNLKNETVEIIHLPGHTPGSIGVLHKEKKLLCSGDMLFHGFPMLDNIFGQSSQPDFEKSMEKILQLITDQKVTVYMIVLQILILLLFQVEFVVPGHGMTFEAEKASMAASRYLEFRHSKPHFPSYF